MWGTASGTTDDDVYPECARYAVQARGCNLTDVREACTVRRGASPRDRQFLFSFYSHTRPNYTGHVADSVLNQRIVAGRLEVRCSYCAAPR
jgi:hypothetical protein